MGAHENNNFCDLWSGFEKVGAYLYVDECKKENLSQQFDFVQKSGEKCGGSFVSRCGHGFKIGKTGDGFAILADHGNDFGEIEILDELEVRNSEFCVIETTTVAETTTVQET